jgi:hypothetical protein
MISLHHPSTLFGAARDERQGGAEQGTILAARLHGGIETQYAASTPHYGANDAIILVPWATRPTFVARTAAQLELALEAGLFAAWCTLDALHNHKAYHAVSLAFLRIAALTSIGEHGEQRAQASGSTRDPSSARARPTSGPHERISPPMKRRTSAHASAKPNTREGASSAPS